MSDLDQLIETASRLSNTLTTMAMNERKFGMELCHSLDELSYETYKTAEELRRINNCLVGGVA